jgi:predicted ferric reductase
LNRLRVIKYFWIIAPLMVTAVLWLLSKTRFEQGWIIAAPQALSQILALWAVVLFAIVLLISARSRLIEQIYGGLDKAYKTHGLLSKIAFTLIITHVALLVPHYLETGQDVRSLFVPGDFWPKNFGIASFYLFILLVLITIFRFMPYQAWLRSHKWMGVPFILGGIHAIGADSDIRAYEPLREWIVMALLFGGLAWFYKVFLYSFAAQKYRYLVQEVRSIGAGISELILWPQRNRMNYEPGEFAFISCQTNLKVSSEHHPFSISSTPAESRLRFSYKEAGDYTQSLKHLQAGDQVEVFGSYGEFTSYLFYGFKKQIWIAGGIGITPFLSMLGYEVRNQDIKTVWLFYATRTTEDAVYDAEINQLINDTPNPQYPDHISYLQHASSRDGQLTAALIQEKVGDLTDYAILLCGPPPLMRGLKQQFVELGVKPSR